VGSRIAAFIGYNHGLSKIHYFVSNSTFTEVIGIAVLIKWKLL